MMARTHLAFGFLFGLLYMNFFSVSNPILFMSFVLLGALLTDIDHPQSKAGRKIKPISHLIEWMFGHRGLFHSIWIPLILFLVYNYWFKHVILLGIIVGYVSHLLIDGLTIKGINYLNPFTTLRLHGFVETNTVMETVILLTIIVLDVLWFFRF